MTFLATTPKEERQQQQVLAQTPGDPDAFKPGLFEGAGTAAAVGVGRVGAVANQLVAEAGYQVGALFTRPLDELLDTDTTGFLNTYLRLDAQQLTANMTPDPMTTGLVGQVLYSLVGVGVPAIAGGVIGGPAGAAATAGAFTTTGTFTDLTYQGVDPGTAAGAALFEGGLMAAGVGLPAAISGKVALNTLLYGPGINVGQSIIAGQGNAAWLEARGYGEIAERYATYDAQMLAADVVLGAAFGWAGARAARAPRGTLPQPKTGDVDAALTALDQRHVEVDTAPGLAADFAAVRSHNANLQTATEQLLAGQPVETAALNGSFVPKPPLRAEFADPAFAETLAEAGHPEAAAEVAKMTPRLTPAEAGEILDRRLAALDEAAARGLLTPDQARALAAEAAELEALVRAQDRAKADGVLLSPAEKLTPAERRQADNRRGEIRSLLEQHRTAQAHGKQAEGLRARLDRIDNDRDLLNLADELSGSGYDADQQAALRLADIPEETRAGMAQAYRRAAETKPEFDRRVNAIADALGAHFKPKVPNKLKGLTRALEKVMGKYRGDATRLRDIVRATVVIDHIDDVPAAIALAQRYFNVVSIENSLDRNVAAKGAEGYRDVNLNVEVDGVIGELQINVPAMLEAKEGPGHKLYEQQRTLAERIMVEGRDPTPEEFAELKRLREAQIEVYGAAWDAATAERNPDSSVGLAAFQNSAMFQRRGGSVSNARQVPSGSSASGTPSSRANSVPAGNRSGTSGAGISSTSGRKASTEPGIAQGATDAPPSAPLIEQQAADVVAEMPDLMIVNDAGEMVPAAVALADADATIAFAKSEAPAFAEAVACFLRRGA